MNTEAYNSNIAQIYAGNPPRVQLFRHREERKEEEEEEEKRRTISATGRRRLRERRRRSLRDGGEVCEGSVRGSLYTGG